MTTRERPLDEIDQKPGRWRGRCPECHGTGFVFVMDEGPGMLPLKRHGTHWGKPRKMRCGMCGGDGRIDEWDVGPIGAHVDPDDWYMQEKRKYAD